MAIALPDVEPLRAVDGPTRWAGFQTTQGDVPVDMGEDEQAECDNPDVDLPPTCWSSLWRRRARAAF